VAHNTAHVVPPTTQPKGVTWLPALVRWCLTAVHGPLPPHAALAPPAQEFPLRPRSYYEKAFADGRLRVEGGSSSPDTPLRQGQCMRHLIHRHEPPTLDADVKARMSVKRQHMHEWVSDTAPRTANLCQAIWVAQGRASSDALPSSPGARVVRCSV
jgi:hypothetical protein